MKCNCSILVFALFNMISCSHTPSTFEEVRSPVSLSSTDKISDFYTLNDYKGMTLENTVFDIPVTVNPLVSRWIKYFSSDKKGKLLFQHYLSRAEKYIPKLQDKLTQEKAPTDLVFLALIESGYSNYSNSKAKAVGLWQFIKPTGERYGLKINGWIDERRDPEKATSAAIQYLKALKLEFKDWNLALAAYNCGEARVEEAILEGKTRDYWKLVQLKLLPRETSEYIPKFIAAAILVKNAELFGLKQFEGDENFWLQISSQNVLNKEKEFVFLDIYYSSLLSTKKEIVNKDVYQIIDPNIRYFNQPLETVKFYDVVDLIKLSDRLGISFDELRIYNPHIVSWISPPNQETELKIPTNKIFLYGSEVSSNLASFYPNLLACKFTSIKKLKNIANQYRINESLIYDLNKITDKSQLKPGMVLLLPVPKDKGENKIFISFNSKKSWRRNRN